MKSLTLSIIFLVLNVVAVPAQNLKPEEIIAKHADAIGSKDKRGALTTTMALGLSEFQTTSPAIKGGGRAVVVSDPNNLFFVISLNSHEYPFDKVGYFDGKPSLPFVNAGNRSLLGAFINEHPKILSEGIFGGAMSLRWPLLKADAQRMRLKGGGTKKVADKKAYVIEYDPGSGGTADFSIKLFFDAETFQHLRTEYRYEVQPGSPTFGRQNQMAASVGTLTEDFSDFKTVDGITLPYKQKIEFTSNLGSGEYKSIWSVRVAEYRLNQKLADGFFTFDPK